MLTLKWTDYPCYNKLNTGKKKSLLDMDDDVAIEIEYHNQEDMKLYDWACSEFEEQINKIQNLDSRVHILSIANRAFVNGIAYGASNERKSNPIQILKETLVRKLTT